MNVRDLQPALNEGVGIEVRKDGEPPVVSVRCLACDETWQPKLKKSGDLPSGWYMCPDDCNRSRMMPDPDRFFRRQELSVAKPTTVGTLAAGKPPKPARKPKK